MIKMTAHKPDGTPILMLGITDENIRRLRDDKPIGFNTKEVDLGDMEIAIIYGKTEAAIIDQLRQAGVGTPVRRDL